MADGKVTISTALDNGGLLKGIKNVSGSFGGLSSVIKKLGATIAAAFTVKKIADFIKSTVDAYADFEQLTGGITTLFKDSASKIIAYSEDAFYTAGVSANKYMEVVTSFSASLISSLGGDTAKAADIANMAMIDMADNANKMGTDIGMLQSAYQGFAKQNYTMLDNLKLGFGGTKTEMQRLLKTAESITGIKYNINNLADVYSAIHVIQEELGIAGATADEAEKTITGAANMTKAAWQNVLAAIAGGGDLDKAINNLVFAISKYFKNLVPVVQRSITGIGELIEKVAPSLVQNVASALIQAIPSLLNAVYQMIIGLAKGIYQGIVALFSGKGGVGGIAAQLNEVSGGFGAAAGGAEDLAEATEGAGKAAKRSLAGFDELNKLQDPNSGGGGAAGGGGGGFASGGGVDTTEGMSAMEAVGGFVDNLKAKLQEFGAWFTTTYQPAISAWGDAFRSLAPAIEETGGRISTAWTNLKENSLIPFSSYIINEFVPGVVNTFSTTFAPIFTDVMHAALAAFATDFENATLVIGEACGHLETLFDGVKTVFSDMCDSITKNWDEYGGNLLQGFTEFREGLWDIWWNIYDNIIDPVITAVGDTFDWLWDKHLKPLWDSVVEFALSVSENILALWNKCLKPFIDRLILELTPFVVNAIKIITDAVAVVVAYISDVISSILTWLDGLIQFVVGVFTLDWERAWGGIKKMFEGAWDGMLASAKFIINAIILALNTLIAAVYSAVAGFINGLGSTVKTIGNLIGKDWGFSMPSAAPQIPYLAKGAVLPANKPFLAMVGDQRHGTNIEAPLSTIQEAVALVMKDQTSAIMAGFNASVEVQREILSAVLGIQIGDDVIAAAYDRYSTKTAMQRGV